MSETHTGSVRVDFSDFVKAIYLHRDICMFQIRRRVGEQQASPRQAMYARLIEIFGEVLSMLASNVRVTSVVRPIKITYLYLSLVLCSNRNSRCWRQNATY